jgi:hypothetical protein
MADVADEDRLHAQRQAVQHVLDSERELIGAAERRSEHSACAAGRLHADIPARARPHEQAYLDAMPAPQRHHFSNLIVGLQHDAAALTDSVDGEIVRRGALQNGFHRPRPFRRRNLDSIMAAVAKSLCRGGQIVGIAYWQLEAGQHGVGLGHFVSPGRTG